MAADLATGLATVPAMAIIRHREPGDTAAGIDALVAGGIRALEVTTSTPGWERLVATAPRDVAAVGVGTVTCVEHVERAAAAGAAFVVAPGLQPGVVRAAQDAGLEPVPGVATGTEILMALDLGVRFFKLFPAGALGLAYFRELRGPFADLDFLPTGGIEIGGIAPWFAAGARAVALGSALAGRAAPRTAEEVAAVTERARAVVAEVAGAGA